jgi:SAM-dependent methyltransferase
MLKFDLGCGSGRWARLVAPRVGQLHCIDPSPAALNVARQNLADHGQCEFHQANVDSIPLSDDSADFGYSLGVLHHVPDTAAGIKACVRKLKRGAPLLLYLYYAFDNRPHWYRAIWSISNLVRLLLSRSPYPLRFIANQVIAFGVYWPMARLACLLERLGLSVDALPLAFYRQRSLYVMRTDALDRFGTRLEQRISRQQIRSMMEEAGLSDIVFSESSPYWCAVGIKQ